MVNFYRKMISWYELFHDFHILYEAVSQFSVNLITHFNEEKVYEEIRTTKNLSLKIEEATSDVLRSLRKRKSNISNK